MNTALIIFLAVFAFFWLANAIERGPLPSSPRVYHPKPDPRPRWPGDTPAQYRRDKLILMLVFVTVGLALITAFVIMPH